MSDDTLYQRKKKEKKKKAFHMQIAYDIANTGTESHPERSMTAVNNIIEEKNPKQQLQWKDQSK